MKSTRKEALKALVILALFCPAVFADGEMGGGGRLSDPDYFDSVLTGLSRYLDWIM